MVLNPPLFLYKTVMGNLKQTTILLKSVKILIGLTLLVNSCNYKMTTIVDSSGDKHRVREYKNYDDQKVYNENRVFERPNQLDTNSRYNGSISLITTDSLQYVQYDSVRVVLGEKESKFIKIFSSGLLNSKVIYCTLDSLCRPPSPMLIKEVQTGKVVKPHIGDWYGDVIHIGLIEEPEHLKISPNKRRFKLWVNTIYGAYGYNVFFIELTNHKVDSYVDIEEFVKNASLTFIDSPWSII